MPSIQIVNTVINPNGRQKHYRIVNLRVLDNDAYQTSCSMQEHKNKLNYKKPTLEEFNTEIQTVV
jgi:hypothetical protein